MGNVAKINLSVSSCSECPFSRSSKTAVKCVHEKMMNIDVDEGDVVPDFCPFVVQRIEAVMQGIENLPNTTIPKTYLETIRKKQNKGDYSGANSKYGVDHAWYHMRRVQEIGIDFLQSCVDFGYVSPDSIQKEVALFKIAAFMHDIGLAESVRNHAIHSSELAKKYLLKQDIDEEDVHTITHAIANHSSGDDTRTIVDVALLIADKLDVIGDRVIKPVDAVSLGYSHVKSASYNFVRKRNEVVEAVLKYETEGFDAMEMMRIYPKGVYITKYITLRYFKIPSFRYIVDGKEIDTKNIKC